MLKHFFFLFQNKFYKFSLILFLTIFSNILSMEDSSGDSIDGCSKFSLVETACDHKGKLAATAGIAVGIPAGYGSFQLLDRLKLERVTRDEGKFFALACGGVACAATAVGVWAVCDTQERAIARERANLEARRINAEAEAARNRLGIVGDVAEELAARRDRISEVVRGKISPNQNLLRLVHKGMHIQLNELDGAIGRGAARKRRRLTARIQKLESSLSERERMRLRLLSNLSTEIEQSRVTIARTGETLEMVEVLAGDGAAMAARSVAKLRSGRNAATGGTGSSDSFSFPA